MKFNVIVLDPPWEYRNLHVGGTSKSGASKQYPTLSFKELKGLAPLIKNVCEKDCCMFLWITNPMLREGLELLKEYGFEYKTIITWVKNMNGKGMGYWYRGNTEHMLLGVKGNIKAFHSQEINVFHSEIRQHSQKPVKSYELILEGTRTIKNCKTLEIFARKYFRDWICIGMDLDGLDIRCSLEQISRR